MKHSLLLLFLFIARFASANMASPVHEGTAAASAFSSRNIDILSEKIGITIDKNFHTAAFDIIYHIKTDTGGIEVPLLFCAKDYKGLFKVWVDGSEVQVFDVKGSTDTSWTLESFSNAFQEPNAGTVSPTVLVYWEENSGNYESVQDLKYFKARLAKGEHTIRVNYIAYAWTDTYNWVNDYSFRYSLSPAKYWRSFGTLEISLNVPQLDSPITTNLGAPVKGDFASTAEWKFSKLPADFILISYNPEPNFLAKILILLHPAGLSLILAVFLFLLSRKMIRKYKAKHPAKKATWLIIINSGLAAFFILAGFMLFFPMIDAVIGSSAGEYHGYTFMIFIFYPLLAPVYGVLLWLTTRTRVAQ